MKTKQFLVLALFSSLAATAGAMEEDRPTKAELLDDWTMVNEQDDSSQQEELYGLAVEAALNQGNTGLVERLFEEQRRGTKITVEQTEDGHPVFKLAVSGTKNSPAIPSQTAQKPSSLNNNNNDASSYAAAGTVSSDDTQDKGDTALHKAARSGDAELVGNLLDTDLMLCFAQNNDGATPLHIAASCGDAVIVQILVAYEAQLDARTRTGDTPLHLAVKHPEVVKLLLDCGAPVGAVTLDGDTPLHAAAFWGNVDTAKLLLQRWALIDAATIDGTTPLHYAAERGHTEFVKLLVERKAQIATTRKDGFNALRLAAKNGHNNIVKALFETEESTEGLCQALTITL